MRSETQPYSTVIAIRLCRTALRFFPQNFGTIKRILPGSSSLSHREGPGTEVGFYQKYARRVQEGSTFFFVFEN